MRFIHTADWHIGRLFHSLHLTEDQTHVLQQVVDLAKKVKPDAILISGDVFDRAVPPPDAVAVVDDILSTLVLGLKIPVVIIAGNHDSPQRLEFGSKLLRQQGLHIVGNPSKAVQTIRIEDGAGPVFIYTLPFAEPSVMRGCMEDESIQDHNTAMQAMVRSLKAAHPKGSRSILMAHATVTGGSECESERPLCIGGASSVDSACFDGFSYVALGHLHCPQSVGGDHIHYSGSLMKYSFSEATHTKSVNVVEMDEKGHCKIERVPLTARRDVRSIQGLMEDILKGPKNGESKDDYIHVMLEDKVPILDAIGKIRQIYPNVLFLERMILSALGGEVGARIDHRKMGEREIFSAFFKEVTGDAVTEPELAVYASVVTQMQQAQREAN